MPLYKVGQPVRIRDDAHPHANKFLPIVAVRSLGGAVIYDFSDGRHAFSANEEQVDLPPKGWRPPAPQAAPQAAVDPFKMFG